MNPPPTLKGWLICALKEITLDQNTIVIGHSVGAVLALRLAESQKIGKLILVSGWDFWDLTPEKTFFAKPVNHKKIIKNVGEIVVIYSDNDPYFTTFIAKEFAKRLEARFVLLKGKGHFTKTDGVVKVREILDAI